MAGSGVRTVSAVPRPVAHIDVSALAPRVSCPTLIPHSRGDLRVPRAQEQELATLIPDGELRFLHSRNHILTAGEPASPVFLAEIDGFLRTGVTT